VVNRIWYQFFGKGLATSIDDFGNQGTMPTHLELLDYLSIKFVESGWDVKKLIKMIVMSNTYRQSSKIPEKATEHDPANELYTRGNSYRLSHEQIRDKVLTASGLLSRKIGGKSVYPYQPDGIWEALTTRNLVHYNQSHNDSLYRRGLYTFWKRSSPPPSAVTFDASDRYNCIVKKQKTSTPLQSLVLMNDPQYMEAARVLGERMMHEAGSEVDKRITLAFKALASRNPSKNELDILRKMYLDELSFYRNKKSEAEKITNIGEFKRDKTLDISELAACTMVATTLINYDEAVMKR
jgi:hypothetical protein